MNITTALKLGRISNLPTVWTNVLVGCALVNPQFSNWTAVLTALAISLFYIAGMLLNDVFDFQWDRQNQVPRPLVLGDADRREVIIFSLACIFAGIALLLSAAPGRQVPVVLVSVLTLLGLMILYNWKHKQWRHSSWIMGGCRCMVYVIAGAMVGGGNQQLLLAGISLAAYIAGTTYLARAEHNNRLQYYWPMLFLFLPLLYAIYLGKSFVWTYFMVAMGLIWLLMAIWQLIPRPQRRVSRSIAALLAGICLIDACILLALQQYGFSLSALFAFILCLTMQKYIAAT